MIITLEDLNGWKQRTLETAEELGLEKDILHILSSAKLIVLPGYSGPKFFGYAYCRPPRVEVYESNPSKYMPKFLRDIWNQSGMDHELIGHLYNFYLGLRYDEVGARQTQVGFARHRGKSDTLWKIVAILEPSIREIQKHRNRIFYAT